jgi:hypothetical protein
MCHIIVDNQRLEGQSTHSKNTEAVQLARDSCHNGVAVRSHYVLSPTTGCGFLEVPETMLHRRLKPVPSQPRSQQAAARFDKYQKLYVHSELLMMGGGSN